MLNRLVSLAMSTSVLKVLPGQFDIKRHSPCILYIEYSSFFIFTDTGWKGVAISRVTTFCHMERKAQTW